MSDNEEVEQSLQNNAEEGEVELREVQNTEKADIEEIEKESKPFEKRTYKTKYETAKESKQRAIDNFKRGVVDPEYKVVKMSNGKFRCYPRKEPLPPDPIKLNQIPDNKPSSQIEANHPDIEVKPFMPTPCDSSIHAQARAKKEHDPFQDIVYYNMTNQISEQLNKRLDMVNLEIERLRNKNSKLKNKYKQLKQAIYITEEEEQIDSIPAQLTSQKVRAEQQSQPIQHNEPITIQSNEPDEHNQQHPLPFVPITRRTNGINYNRFFN